MSIRVFISWSGARSKVVAEALRKVLPDAMQQASVWMSANDIQAGERWGPHLNQQLTDSHFGILCLTKENARAPWLLFEAGSLAKSVDVARVLPLLVDLEPADIPPPLTQFQATPINRDGFQRILHAINSQTTSPLSEDRLSRIAEQWWPYLERELVDLKKKPVTNGGKSPSELTDTDRLQEILTRLRSANTDPVTSATWSHSAIEGFIVAARRFHEMRHKELLSTKNEIVARGGKPSGMYDDYADESEDLIQRLSNALNAFQTRPGRSDT